MSEQPSVPVYDLGDYLGAQITWFNLEYIFQMLRQHHRIEIRCGFDPYVSSLITQVLPLKVESKDK